MTQYSIFKKILKKTQSRVQHMPRGCMGEIRKLLIGPHKCTALFSTNYLETCATLCFDSIYIVVLYLLGMQ